MNQEKSRSPNWGGARENAGRKSIWKHKETCTIRIPQVFAPKLHEIAQKWDKDPALENKTESSSESIDFVTKTNLDLPQAIDLAKKILRHKKSARISLAKFLSKLYNSPVKLEDLQ